MYVIEMNNTFFNPEDKLSERRQEEQLEKQEFLLSKTKRENLSGRGFDRTIPHTPPHIVTNHSTHMVNSK